MIKNAETCGDRRVVLCAFDSTASELMRLFFNDNKTLRASLEAGEWLSCLRTLRARLLNRHHRKKSVVNLHRFTVWRFDLSRYHRTLSRISRKQFFCFVIAISAEFLVSRAAVNFKVKVASQTSVVCRTRQLSWGNGENKTKSARTSCSGADFSVRR